MSSFEAHDRELGFAQDLAPAEDSSGSWAENRVHAHKRSPLAMSSAKNAKNPEPEPEPEPESWPRPRPQPEPEPEPEPERARRLRVVIKESEEWSQDAQFDLEAVHDLEGLRRQLGERLSMAAIQLMALDQDFGEWIVPASLLECGDAPTIKVTGGQRTG